ncbi:RNA-directed DNA polymerase, eukaryota [Tanacetum coccineum]
MSIVNKMSYANIADTFRRFPMEGEESEQYIDICNRLEMVQLSQMHDRWFWSLVGTGEFSVKSVRNLVDDTLLHLDSSLTRWIKMIPIKVNVFVWRVRMDKLPTRLNLSLRGVDIPSILCPVCDVVVESTSHILFSCPLARDVLCKVMTWWDLDTPNILSYEEWLCWFSNLHIHKQAKIILEGDHMGAKDFCLMGLRKKRCGASCNEGFEVLFIVKIIKEAKIAYGSVMGRVEQLGGEVLERIHDESWRSRN